MSRLAKLTFVSTARRLVLFVGMLLLFVIALDLLWQLGQPFLNLSEPSGNYHVQHPWWLPFKWVPLGEMQFLALFVFGLVALALPFVYLYLAMVQARLEHGIIGKGSDGEDICLTPEAVERVVVREVRANVPAVLRVRHCEARQGTQSVRVYLAVGVTERAPVPQVRRDIHTSIENTLTRVIGYAEGAEIKVKVTDIEGASAKRRPGKPSRTQKAPPKEPPKERIKSE